MKPNAVFAIVLIFAGVLALVYQGFTYTTREKVVDLGSVHVTADKTRPMPLPPIPGVIAIMGGVLLLTFGGKKAWTNHPHRTPRPNVKGITPCSEPF